MLRPVVVTGMAIDTAIAMAIATDTAAGIVMDRRTMAQDTAMVMVTGMDRDTGIATVIAPVRNTTNQENGIMAIDPSTRVTGMAVRAGLIPMATAHFPSPIGVTPTSDIHPARPANASVGPDASLTSGRARQQLLPPA